MRTQRRTRLELAVHLAVAVCALLAGLQLDSAASDDVPPAGDPAAPADVPAGTLEPEAPADTTPSEEPAGTEPNSGMPATDPPEADEPQGEDPAGPSPETPPEPQEAVPPQQVTPAPDRAVIVRASDVVIEQGSEPLSPDRDEVVLDRAPSGDGDRPPPGSGEPRARAAGARAAQSPPRTEGEIFPPGNPCEAPESAACEAFVTSLLDCRDPDSAACAAMIDRLRSNPCPLDPGSAACEGWVIEHLLLGLSFLECDQPEAICAQVFERGVPRLGCPEAQPRTEECAAVEAVVNRVCARYPICGAGGTSEPTGPRGRGGSVLVGLFDPGGRGDRGRPVSDKRRVRPRRLPRTGLQLERVALVALMMVGGGSLLRRRFPANGAP